MWCPPERVFLAPHSFRVLAFVYRLLIAKFDEKLGSSVLGTRPVSLFGCGIFVFAFGSLERHREIKMYRTKGSVINVIGLKSLSAIHH
jgi:hypothetical protein